MRGALVQTRRRAVRNAFTLTELLLVISIFVLLLALSVPAFSSMVNSANAARADAQLQVAVASARDAAVRGDTPGDTALGFFYELSGEMRLQVMLYADTIVDQDEMGDRFERDVFVPDPSIRPIRLPRGWMARGYAPAATLRAQEDQLFEQSMTGTAERDRGHWIFPETAFYDATEGDNGEARQSVMMRFRARTGRPATSETRSALLVDAAPWTGFRRTGLYRDFRLDEAPDLVRFVGAVKGRLSGDDLAEVIGDRATDTVLATPVREVALYRDEDLAAGLGVRSNRVTRTLYTAPATITGTAIAADETAGWLPEYVGNNLSTEQISNWLEGRDPDSGDPAEDPADTRIYSVDQSSGVLREVVGDEL